MPDMINPQKGIDLMNNTSIINRIIFAVTIFQQLLLQVWGYQREYRGGQCHHGRKPSMKHPVVGGKPRSKEDKWGGVELSQGGCEFLVRGIERMGIRMTAEVSRG
jgi:hypothetical protein